MKTKMMGLIVVALSCSFSVQADEIWDSGYHEIVAGDVYNEIWMSNDATAIMFGGDVFKVETFHTSSFEMRGGEMDILVTHDDSEVDIYGESMGSMYIFDDSMIDIFSGSLVALGAVGNSVINLYAYGVVHHATDGSNYNGWVEGRYYADDVYFSFDLLQENSFLHINIVPEPCILSLMAIGGFIVKRKIEKKCT